MMTKLEIAKKVMEYANENYSQGWDEVVECLDATDLIRGWERCEFEPDSVEAAIAFEAETNDVRKSVRDDAILAGGDACPDCDSFVRNGEHSPGCPRNILNVRGMDVCTCEVDNMGRHDSGCAYIIQLQEQWRKDVLSHD